MKKLLLALSAILLTACSKDTTEAVRQFAADFAIKVSKNQKDSLLSVWPDVAKADSLVLSFVEDSIKIEPNAKGDSILIRYTPDVWVRVLKDANDSIRIVSSKGLFAYPAEQMEFAQRTGQYDHKLTDLENAVRMADEGFKPYLIKKHMKDAAKKLKVVGKPTLISSKGEFSYEIINVFGVTVQSTSDQPISGADYKVYFKGDYRGQPWNWNVKGIDVAPNSSVTITTEVTMWNYPERAYVNTTLSEEAHFNKYFKPTGNEYDEYLVSKK